MQMSRDYELEFFRNPFLVWIANIYIQSVNIQMSIRIMSKSFIETRFFHILKYIGICIRKLSLMLTFGMLIFFEPSQIEWYISQEIYMRYYLIIVKLFYVSNYIFYAEFIRFSSKLYNILKFNSFCKHKVKDSLVFSSEYIDQAPV